MKKTFWEKLMVTNGFTIEEVAKYLECSVDDAEGYLKGEKTMIPHILYPLCEFFNVDEDVANRENQRMYNERRDKNIKKRNGKDGAYSSNNTYWTKLRLKNNYTLKYLSEYCECAVSDMSKYCAGKSLCQVL